MSGETEKHVSGWSVDTLKEYFEQRFTDQDKAVQAALLATKEAITKAETAAEKRFDGVNEFRRTLSDQTATFIPRQEYTVQHESLEKLVSDLADRMNRSDGKGAGINAGWGYMAGAVGLAATIISVVLAFNN